MAGETTSFETSGPKYMQRLVGLIWLIISVVLLDAFENSALFREVHVGDQVSARMLLGVMAIPGLIAGRIGLGLICGEAGAYFDHRVREIVIWRRNLLFTRSFVRRSPNEFSAIRVQKWRERGFPAKLDGYAMTLPGKDRTRKVDFFKTKNEAVESANRLAACTNLAIEVE